VYVRWSVADAPEGGRAELLHGAADAPGPWGKNLVQQQFGVQRHRS
jgi:hypothetical protein